MPGVCVAAGEPEVHLRSAARLWPVELPCVITMCLVKAAEKFVYWGSFRGHHEMSSRE